MKDADMTETDLRIVDGFDGVLRCYAGKKVRDEVMEGSDLLTSSTESHDFAEWVKGAMIRLDEVVDQGTRERIMRDCGRQCSLEYKEIIQSVKERRKKYERLDDFLDSEIETHFPGMRLEREGDVLYQIYDPASFDKPLRCYCNILRSLSSNEMVSLTYCHCSEGFIKSYWEQVLDRDVRVEILESVISGGKECKFAIHLPEDAGEG
jgi:predicted hydrocarbon binding protein